MASFPQFFVVIGLCTGYFICYGSVHINNSFAWRFPFAFQAFVAVAFSASSLIFLPESPRWLAAMGRHEKAEAVWNQLGVLVAEREKASNIATSGILLNDTLTSDRGIHEEHNNAATLRTIKVKMSLLDVFGKDVQKQTLLGVFLLGMQQLSGIDAVLYVCACASSQLENKETRSNCPNTVCSSAFRSGRTR